MVTRYGMSDALGNVDLGSNHDTLSTSTKELIESEVRRVIEEGRVRATNLIMAKRRELDLLAKALVDYETLNNEEAFRVVKGERLNRMIMPGGGMKLPEKGPGGAGSLPEIPSIPGSEPTGQGKEPPKGGALA